MAILAKKHDLIALQVLDDSELELPKAGVLRFVDPETGHSEYINTANAKLRQAYKASIQQEQEKLKTTLKAMGCDYMLFKNSDSFVRVLRQFFVQRSRRRKR